MALVSEFDRHAGQEAPQLGKSVVQLWRSLRKDLFDPYRPERHYMRGPGPKWRAKQAYGPSGRRPGL
jgi:hypothetical protein